MPNVSRTQPPRKTDSIAMDRFVLKSLHLGMEILVSLLLLSLKVVQSPAKEVKLHQVYMMLCLKQTRMPDAKKLRVQKRTDITVTAANALKSHQHGTALLVYLHISSPIIVQSPVKETKLNPSSWFSWRIQSLKKPQVSPRDLNRVPPVFILNFVMKTEKKVLKFAGELQTNRAYVNLEAAPVAAPAAPNAPFTKKIRLIANPESVLTDRVMPVSRTGIVLTPYPGHLLLHQKLRLE